MNTKVGSVIAVELGILIAILAWLAFARGPVSKPRAATDSQPRLADSFTTAAPLFQSRNQAAETDDSEAVTTQTQPPANAPGAMSPVFVQQIAPEPYTDSGLQDDSLGGASPYYSELDEEPLLTPPDLFAPPVAQFVELVQPTRVYIISRFAANRRPGTRCWGGPGRMIPPQRSPHLGPPHARVPSPGLPPSHGVGGSATHRKPTTRPSPPNQALKVTLSR